jgi:hypothetical protein
MKIIFQHPPTGTKDPFKDFEPWNPRHYPEGGGVYIYGLRTIVNGVLKFIPLVVGQSDDLQNRLHKDHYMGKFANPLAIILGNGSLHSGDPKEIWDFSNSFLTIPELVKIYKDIDSYDNTLGKKNKVAHVALLKNLIFFQDCNFFHLKHAVNPIFKKKNIKTEQSVKYLVNMLTGGLTKNTNDIIQHISKILLSLNCFRDSFYFVYAIKSEGINLLNMHDRESAEKATKKQLKSIKLYTTADARKGKEMPIQIDLTEIQDELVNVGSRQYNDLNGNYKNPLIIK